MNIFDVENFWLKHFNEKYHEYFESDREPRYQVKQFFIYSFQLLKRFGVEWDNYLDKYENLFLRDPSKDWYSLRNIDSKKPDESRRNKLEWTTLFEIINYVGYPVTKSARKNLLKYGKINLDLAIKDLPKEFHSLMVSSAVTNVPEFRDLYFKTIVEYINKIINSDDKVSVHMLISYVNLLQQLGNEESLKLKIVDKIVKWIGNPSGDSRPNLLVVSRLAVRLDWEKLVKDPKMILEKLKNLYSKYLSENKQIDWLNSGLFLEAGYYLNSKEIQTKIEKEISERITPSQLVSLKGLFPYLNNERLEELDNEVKKIPEKCMPSPTKEICEGCMVNKVSLCWMRILAKELKVNPGFHGPFEVADTVIYTLEQGIYFVLKANKITKQRGEGDVLFRQCAKLFSKDHALVFYLNSEHTEPSVLEEIKNAEKASSHSPKFLIIDNKYINQIYKHYKSNFD